MAEALPTRMRAVLLTGHGGYEKLVHREDVPVPRPGSGEVLVRVAAAGVNNTDVNTRIGWYSKGVHGGTGAGAAAGFAQAPLAAPTIRTRGLRPRVHLHRPVDTHESDSRSEASPEDAAWTGTSISFPRIQGADCCGRIAAVGDGVDPARCGERVLVRPVMRSPLAPPPACWTFGSECDGAFAEYTVAPAREVFRVECDWDDVELASVPCAYSTAENLLHRAAVAAGERVLVTGASGGVGSAAVQLAKRRGAEVVALAAAAKAEVVRGLGADTIVPRDADLVEELGAGSVDVALDVVGGDGWPGLLDVLRRGGRLATAGAIAGPIVALDVRSLYLKDLTLLGCTYQDEAVFANLVGYVERGEIRPVVARTYPLREIVQAQRDFVAKRYAGKLVLVNTPV
jgi:NADPH:quinone reductase-like Zn-dependent oxidoreductase